MSKLDESCFDSYKAIDLSIIRIDYLKYKLGERNGRTELHDLENSLIRAQRGWKKLFDASRNRG